MEKKEIQAFIEYLYENEKSEHTIEKYERDVKQFYRYLKDAPLEKKAVREYKNELMKEYALRSINSMLASLNSYFRFIGKEELRMKSIKIQKEVFAEERKNLKKKEYHRLIEAAQGDERMKLLLETLGSTGMRVSELQYVTVENYRSGRIKIYNKGKERMILLPKKLIRKIKAYVRGRKIERGKIFVTRSGKSMDRVAIWRKMKKLGEKAMVREEKVYPHNLRHLYAKTYYKVCNDVSRLADLLGHSSMDTTRIYLKEGIGSYQRDIERLGLI